MEHSVFTYHHFHAQIFKCMLHSCQNNLLWPCCTQAAGIRHGTGVKCGNKIFVYKERLPSLDSWIDAHDMVMNFIHFMCQFCQFHDNSSSVPIPADPHAWTPSKCCWEIPLSFAGVSFWSRWQWWEVTGPFRNCRARAQPTNDFRNWKIYVIKQIKLFAEYWDMLTRPRLISQVPNKQVLAWVACPGILHRS